MTELLKIHKVKLLEMCNKLFPEYNEIVLTKQKTLNFGFKDKGSHTVRIANMSIHWFEFCWTNLIQKIYKENTPMERVNNINNFALICYNDFELNHPIDYLYEEFKKLK